MVISGETGSDIIILLVCINSYFLVILVLKISKLCNQKQKSYRGESNFVYTLYSIKLINLYLCFLFLLIVISNGTMDT